MLKSKFLNFRDRNSGTCRFCGKPQWDYCTNPRCPQGKGNDRDWDF
ncbi:hypothetical protein [Vibrio phage vB_VpaP_SJSY21]|nr:hypothetical protein [Vibrio phage vB_VpaP_SJSY21]